MEDINLTGNISDINVGQTEQTGEMVKPEEIAAKLPETGDQSQPAVQEGEIKPKKKKKKEEKEKTPSKGYSSGKSRSQIQDTGTEGRQS